MRTGPLDLNGAAKLCMQSLNALAHAHSLGVVHRDLKPANIMLTENGSIKIMDFGIARVSGTEHLTNAGFLMGTPAYMSPEQVMGGEVDARADLYAMGVVLFFLLSARLPFKGDTPFEMVQSRLRDLPMPVTSAREGLPGWIAQVLDMALARDPHKRLQSAPLFHEALRRGLANLPLDTPEPASAPPELIATVMSYHDGKQNLRRPVCWQN
jgi:serine/threonine-protein kinase